MKDPCTTLLDRSSIGIGYSTVVVFETFLDGVQRKIVINCIFENERNEIKYKKKVSVSQCPQTLMNMCPYTLFVEFSHTGGKEKVERSYYMYYIPAHTRPTICL